MLLEKARYIAERCFWNRLCFLLVLSEGSYEYEIISSSLDFTTLKPAIFTTTLAGQLRLKLYMLSLKSLCFLLVLSEESYQYETISSSLDCTTLKPVIFTTALAVTIWIQYDEYEILLLQIPCEKVVSEMEK